MVLTKKFSEFTSSGQPEVGDIEVGLKGGANTQFTQQWTFYAPGTTAQRPVSPTIGILRWNTTLAEYELWNGSAWVQFEDTTSILALLASHTVNEGASLIGLQNQSGVTSKTAQDLANGGFIVKTNNGSMQNAQALGSLTTGILKSTTSTGVLSISASLTQIDNLTPVQGDILYHNGSAWVILSPGTVGYILQTQGAGANPQWVFDVGTGTVTSVDTGTGLTGGPITVSGTISFANTTDGTILANISGGSAAPTPHTLSAIIDYSLGSTRGDILYRNATAWTILAPGTAAQVLQTGGAGADPSWTNASVGTVTSITAGTGLSGGTITSTGTISLTVPVIAANGGTGLISPTAHGIMIGEGASAMTPIVLSSGQILIGSTGIDPVAAAINSGTGILVANGAGSITVNLAAIASHDILSNITGGSAAPIANTLSDTIDAAIGNVQGDILYRNASGWVVLAPGTSGDVLTTGGAAANPAWSTNGSGTVTSVATNNGLTGGTITATGTIGLAAIADHTLLANISGGSLFPSSTTLTALIDNAIGSTQGNILYRNATVWTVLAPGTSGQFLQTLGAGANPAWAPGDGAGTVTSVATNNGLTGGTITSSGTIGLASIATLTGLVNTTGGSTFPSSTTLTAWIDAAIGSTQGNILYRNGTVWTVLAPGSSGQQLTSGGAGANVSWASAGGTVTSVATGNGITGGTITTTGTIQLASMFSINAGAPSGSLTIDATGNVTRPSQTGFSAYVTTTTAGVTGDGTSYTLASFTEIFDTNSNFNATTGVFTAPVDGVYLFTATICLTVAATNTNTQITLVAAGNQYDIIVNSGASRSLVAGQFYTTFSQIVKMAATNTASMFVYDNGSGSKNITVTGGGSNGTFFSGYLMG